LWKVPVCVVVKNVFGEEPEAGSEEGNEAAENEHEGADVVEDSKDEINQRRYGIYKYQNISRFNHQAYEIKT